MNAIVRRELLTILRTNVAVAGLIAVTGLQLTALALLVSGRTNSTEGALRATYALVLAVVVLPLVPHWFLEGGRGLGADLAATVRCLSPVPAVMEVLGQAGAGN